jgi:hypothetical protein
MGGFPTPLLTAYAYQKASWLVPAAMADHKRPRGRPPSPQGARQRAEIQRAYRERRKAAGKVLRVIYTWAEMTPAEIAEMRGRSDSALLQLEPVETAATG